jgi:hypothetical protein
MSTPITNIPQGLLSLLGLRDFGSVPRFCDLSIAPGIDITQFLLLNREELNSPAIAMSTVTSVGDATTLVPAGELWYVHAQSVGSAVLAAGETLQLQPGYTWNTVFFANGDSVRATVGQRCSSAAWEGFWAPPGSQMALRTNEITTAGSINCRIQLNFTRLRI